MEGEELGEIVLRGGRTGQHRGVMLSHFNITSDAIAAVSFVNILKDDRALSILPLSHMFELTIEIAILYVGASVVYARTLSPETILKLFVSQHVTCMVLVPQALQLFLHGIERQVRQQKKEKQWEVLHPIPSQLPFRFRRVLFRQVHRRFGGH